jgi:hypothetical protein
MKLKILLFIMLFAGIAFTAHGQYEEYIKKIGESSRVSYVMYTDNNGNLYYINTEDQMLDLMKYDLAEDKVIKIADDFVSAYYEGNDAYNEGFGAISPTVTGDTVYCMTTAGHNHGNADVFRLICSKNTLEHVRAICGINYWKIFNMTLSQDQKALYYIGNNTSTGKKLYKIDLVTNECDAILDLDPVIPHFDLCFGGINVWDKFDHFYLPVWSYDYEVGDLAVLQIYVGDDEYSAEVLEFTDDLSDFGTRLFPEFSHHSCWSGIGKSSEGMIYIAASNHTPSTTNPDTYGNAAIYKYDPEGEDMYLLGDLRSVSESVDNWMQYESQMKVHSFIHENADGKMYFTTMDYYPSQLVRGSHIYTIDKETDELTDYSKTQSYVMKRDFSVVENTDVASTTSGVACEYYAIKSFSLNKHVPDIMYGMTFSRDASGNDPGYVIRFKLEGDFVNSSIIPKNESSQVMVYPNPFTDQVTFDLSRLSIENKPVLRIYDLYGRLLSEKVFISDQSTWNGTDLLGINVPGGIYVYSVEHNGSIIKGKIIKQ